MSKLVETFRGGLVLVGLCCLIVSVVSVDVPNAEPAVLGLALAGLTMLWVGLSS